jgi:glucokinase
LESRTGEVLSTLNKFADIQQVDLSAWSARELGLPVRFENDARMALLGEHSAGAAQGAQDVVMVTLGTGIGGAAMLQGHLLHSRYGQAGCLGGHLTVNFRGRRCKCGAIGCAEAEASTSVLEEVCRE